MVDLDKHVTPNANEIIWTHPAKIHHLGIDEVHIWRAILEFKAFQMENLIPTLTSEELERAKRFYFQRDHDRFIVTRGLLRIILGHYLNIEPSQLEFCYNSYGKPYIAGESGQNSLHFNLSQSYGVALYALCWGQEIGVDIERIDPKVEIEQISERFFTPREVANLRSLPKKKQTEVFFKCWTRKEAYLKAKGVGLSIPLNNFEVSLVSEKSTALLNTSCDSKKADQWSLIDLNSLPGYAATLAVKGGGWYLKY